MKKVVSRKNMTPLLYVYNLFSLYFVTVLLCGAFQLIVAKVIIHLILEVIGKILLFNVMVRVVVRIEVMLTAYLGIRAVVMHVLQMAWEIARRAVADVS